MKPSIMSSYHSQTLGPGKMMVAFGPSNTYCGLSPLGADVAMVDSHNQHAQGCLLKVNLLDGQT